MLIKHIFRFTTNSSATVMKVILNKKNSISRDMHTRDEDSKFLDVKIRY